MRPQVIQGAVVGSTVVIQTNLGVYIAHIDCIPDALASPAELAARRDRKRAEGRRYKAARSAQFVEAGLNTHGAAYKNRFTMQKAGQARASGNYRRNPI